MKRGRRKKEEGTQRDRPLKYLYKKAYQQLNVRYTKFHCSIPKAIPYGWWATWRKAGASRAATDQLPLVMKIHPSRSGPKRGPLFSPCFPQNYRHVCGAIASALMVKLAIKSARTCATISFRCCYRTKRSLNFEIPQARSSQPTSSSISRSIRGSYTLVVVDRVSCWKKFFLWSGSGVPRWSVVEGRTGSDGKTNAQR